MKEKQTQKRWFHRSIIGCPYKAGQKLGSALLEIPQWKSILCNGEVKLPHSSMIKIENLFIRHCPSLLEEIQGTADILKIDRSQMLFFLHSYLQKGNCSHFAALPSITKQEEILLGRSYEFSHELDDFTFCSTSIEGKFRHMGSSTLLFGRLDGMNEKGLAISMSAGGFPIGQEDWMDPPLQTGLQFWILIREILENCATVDEALGIIEGFPLASNPNLILADRGGEACLVECAGSLHGIKRINPLSDESFLVSANHYTLPMMNPASKGIRINSQQRYDNIEKWLAGNHGKIDGPSIKDFLSKSYPHGPACHFYEEGFGTLRSILFNPSQGNLEICFGSPLLNPWYCFDFEIEEKEDSFFCKIPLEKTPLGFWDIL